MIDKKLLVRDILNTLWVIIVLYVAATSINFFFTSRRSWLFINEVIIYPSLKLIIIMTIIEFALLRVKKYIEYLVMIALTIMVCVLVTTLYEKTVALFLFVFPVLTSLFFYNLTLLRVSILVAILSFVGVSAFSENVQAHMKHSDFIIMFAIIMGFSFLTTTLLKHGRKLMNDLLRTTKEKRELITKNIYMERLTRIDPATELYNHRSFHEHLDSIFTFDSPETLDVHVSVLDIDNFKNINDTYGHRAGDSVIVKVAEQIKNCLEGEDFGSRYGGEEFAIVSIGISTEEFFKKIEEIRTNIAAVTFNELEGNHVTISSGIQKLMPGMQKEALFKGADTALYTAKRSGKNRTMISNE
ncbi:diguanylate cyclase (GGDEF)-like protein [Bacillus mesophilus]|uniref:GGDEF domain-containing protein n=1 Tax=Bacillus mesophilus TaxID=1808955 RepID=A0A6M0Q498_9BACI|nr:GGDEF domain-containing protein [Bacillus mesophilus]MBM7660321.1 diguanylate cyclase (GGDEF)-like protein [Bacillus mesophilus]NEY71033.1 GGDEF domain-containing protein [Bacillus mesophilus]